MTAKTRLQDITRILCKTTTDYAELRETLAVYKKLLLDLTGFDMEEEGNRENIDTPLGMALGPTWAVMCIDDIMRTKYFVKGLVKAVTHLLRTQKSVHLLYAGCGPFASLFLPLTSVFGAGELQCTLIEINPQSLQYAQTTIGRLGLGAYIQGIYLMDASTATLPAIPHTDILLTETMQRALLKEHQVHIVANLLPQLSPQTLLIPEKITLELALRSINRDGDHALPASFEPVSTLFELTAATVRNGALAQLLETGRFRAPAQTLVPAAPATGNGHALFVTTTITVFDDEVIRLKESGLTLPVEIALPEPHQPLTIQYLIDRQPLITCERG